MTNDMIAPDALAHLPGAPFTVEEVDSAVASLRTALGWHIAPVRVETVALDVDWGEDTLRLPTRKLVSVEAVRDLDRATLIDPARYRVSRTLARVRRRGGCWPSGFEAVEVDMTHGFEKCPPELVPILGQLSLADRRDRGLRVVSVDDASTTFAGSASSSADGLLGQALLDRYRVPTWAGMV